MDITLTSFITLCVGALYFLKQKKNEEKALVAREQIKKDTDLYKHIKTGMREYKWQTRDDWLKFFDNKEGDLLFETAHLAAYKVNHFAEFRVGFYFKDINEYGLYGSFEDFECYYRTDKAFVSAERLLYDDEESDA